METPKKLEVNAADRKSIILAMQLLMAYQDELDGRIGDPEAERRAALIDETVVSLSKLR